MDMNSMDDILAHEDRDISAKKLADAALAMLDAAHKYTSVELNSLTIEAIDGKNPVTKFALKFRD